jgi:hypothetical protein
MGDGGYKAAAITFDIKPIRGAAWSQPQTALMGWALVRAMNPRAPRVP